MVDTHIKTITFALIDHVSALDPGQAEGLYYVFSIVVIGYKQEMPCSHWECIAEYLHATQIREMILPGCYALELCLL
jgi:hypothetical protein